MARFVYTRLLLMIPVLFIVSLVVFMMIHLIPGDPVSVIMGESGGSAERMEEVRQELGLNDPLPTQYFNFIKGMISGDIVSLRTRQPVIDIFRNQFPKTMQLAFTALGMAILIGVRWGCMRQPTSRRRVTTSRWSSASSVCRSQLLAGDDPDLRVRIAAWLGACNWWRRLETPDPPGIRTGGAAVGVDRAVGARQHDRGFARRLHQDGALEGTLRTPGDNAPRAAQRPDSDGDDPGLTWLPACRRRRHRDGVRATGNRKGTVDGILANDFPLVQGMILLTATTYLFVNLLTDLSYAIIDPRIRF